MGLGATLLLVLGALAVPPPCTARAPAAYEGWQASALGLDLLTRGEVEVAVVCLRRAALLLPESEVVARDLALALAQAGDRPGARTELARARALGDPGGYVAEAVLAAELGDVEAARSAALSAGGVEGLTIAAWLDDPNARRELGQRLGRTEVDGGLVRLVLGAVLAREGRTGRARPLVEHAAALAELSGDPFIFNAARGLSRRLAAEARFGLDAQVSAGAVAVVNPTWQSGETSAAAAADLRAEVGGPLDLGSGTRLRWDGRFDQRWGQASSQRSLWSAGARLSLPFAADERSAVLELGLRIGGALDQAFESIALGLEGGPELHISLSPRWWGVLGLYGLAADFDAGEGAFDRDRVGQRARLGLRYEAETVRGAVAVVGLHDEAVGDAFDALGVRLETHADIQPGPRWRLGGGLTATLRRWGPVGDEAVLGRASRRLELRWTAGLRASYLLWSSVGLEARALVARNEAREGHDYAWALGRLGLRWWW